MDSQRENADSTVAIKIIRFLKELSVCSLIVAHSPKTVLKKRIDKNDNAQALLYKSGPFYDLMKERIQGEQTPVLSADHQYSVCNSIPSYSKFSVASDSETLIVLDFMKVFCPGSIDPERLFSLGRLGRNYLPNRLSEENHSRSVVLNKNKSKFL